MNSVPGDCNASYTFLGSSNNKLDISYKSNVKVYFQTKDQNKEWSEPDALHVDLSENSDCGVKWSIVK